MTNPLNIPLSEDLAAWDPCEIRDLICTTPLRFDEDGIPVGYEAEQLFGMEATHVLAIIRSTKERN